jgi:hypothetical protein
LDGDDEAKDGEEDFELFATGMETEESWQPARMLQQVDGRGKDGNCSWKLACEDSALVSATLGAFCVLLFFNCFCHSPPLWTFDAGALINPVAVGSGGVEVEVGKVLRFGCFAFMCFVSLVEGVLGAVVWILTRTAVFGF